MGEIGLDFYWDDCPREVQYEAFTTQLHLAREVGRPVVIHCREAEEETLMVLESQGFKDYPLLWHCFGKGPDMAARILGNGWHISVPGPVTYKANEELQKDIEEKIRIDEARKDFIANVSHELKTPIGKGRIVAEMLEDATAKKRLVGVFARLDLLISEFSKIEQITSKRYDLALKEYPLMHVIDQAVDLLMLDDQKKEELVKIEGDFDFEVVVDFDLMALALKNLMDNAMKHSLSHKVYVRSDNKTVIIANEGEPLKMAIDEYFQPFVSGSKACGSGLGLGLYIVKNIIAQHGLEVIYRYEEGMHQFSIDFAKGCVA